LARRRLRLDAPPPPLAERGPRPAERVRDARGDTPRREPGEQDGYSRRPGPKVALDSQQAVVFAGFEEPRLHAPLKLGADGLPKSAKYTFAKLALISNTMPRTKQQAEDWFNTHVREGLEAKGFRVGWVRGDQALIGTRQSPEGELISFWRGPANLALTWENEASQARRLEVTQLGDGPQGDDALLKVQAEIARSLAREEEEHQARLERDLGRKLRANRLPNKG